MERRPGRVWVSEWNSGNLSVHDPANGQWRTWRLTGERPRAHAVYVDERDIAWVSDWGGNARWRFDPGTETFLRLPMPRENAMVRQILGRKGELWLPESGTAHISLVRSGTTPQARGITARICANLRLWWTFLFGTHVRSAGLPFGHPRRV